MDSRFLPVFAGMTGNDGSLIYTMIGTLSFATGDRRRGRLTMPYSGIAGAGQPASERCAAHRRAPAMGVGLPAGETLLTGLLRQRAPDRPPAGR